MNDDDEGDRMWRWLSWFLLGLILLGGFLYLLSRAGGAAGLSSHEQAYLDLFKQTKEFCSRIPKELAA